MVLAFACPITLVHGESADTSSIGKLASSLSPSSVCACERQPELSADQDLLQAQQIVVVVQPIACGITPTRRQQTELVVVMQRADRHTGERRYFFDEIGPFRHGLHCTG